MQKPPQYLVGIILLLSAAWAGANPPTAHVHGVARLDIAIGSESVVLSLESPLDSLLGFEHHPRSAAQKAAVREMSERLQHPAALFVLTPAAQCTPLDRRITSPVLEDAPKSAADESHLDLDAEYRYRCVRPAALRDVTVRLFDAFPRLRRLDVQVATQNGQSAARLTPAQRRVTW